MQHTEIVYFREVQSIWGFETHLTPQILGNKPTYGISQLIGKRVTASATQDFFYLSQFSKRYLPHPVLSLVSHSYSPALT